MNKCKTYFKIIGDFNPDEVVRILNLTPSKTIYKGSPRKDGSAHVNSQLNFCVDENYDVYTKNQMQKTILPLMDKIEQLNYIRQNFNAEFYLVIVPQLIKDEIAPSLSPSLDVIDFCHKTRTEIDIDLYIY